MPLSVGDAIELYVQHVCAGKQNDTPRSYRSKLARLARHVGHATPLTALTAADLDDFRVALLSKPTKQRGVSTVAEPLSLFTVKTVLVTVRQFFKWLHARGHVAANVAADLKIPRPTIEPKPISSGDIDAMLKAAATTGPPHERARNVIILYLLRDTGGRVGGLASANLADLDTAKRRLTVREKGGRARTLFLSKPTMRAVKNYLKKRGGAPGPLLMGRFGGLGRGAIYSALRRIALHAGVTGRWNPHAWRHAFARDTISAGCDLARLSQIMGHSDVRVTADYYARFALDELQKAHKKFSPGRQLPKPKKLRQK